MIILKKDSLNSNDFFDLSTSTSSIVGSTVVFVGYVRDFNNISNTKLDHIFIEYYDAMTKKALHDIEKSAHEKWNIVQSIIIHRVGVVKLNEPIVYILVSSKHRDDSFEACRFIIDYLKIKAPFWKKEVSKIHSHWVEQKESDLVKVK